MAKNRTAMATPYERRSGQIAAKEYDNMVAKLNGNIRTRTMPSNRVTFTGDVTFVGPNRMARYGLVDWRSQLEWYLQSALQQFFAANVGKKSPEGITIQPVGFMVTLKVSQPTVVPSLIVTTTSA